MDGFNFSNNIPSELDETNDRVVNQYNICLLYTSDAADEL